MPATNSVRFHRVVRAPAERVYRAFLDPHALVKWLPPFGFTGEVHEMSARNGGGYRMSFANFTTGGKHSFRVTFVDLIPNERLLYTSQFDGGFLPGEMTTTVVLRPVLCGTELSVEQGGIPAAIPAEMCSLGWQESLVQLAQLVEPEIKDS